MQWRLLLSELSCEDVHGGRVFRQGEDVLYRLLTGNTDDALLEDHVPMMFIANHIELDAAYVCTGSPVKKHCLQSHYWWKPLAENIALGPASAAGRIRKGPVDRCEEQTSNCYSRDTEFKFP